MRAKIFKLLSGFDILLSVTTIALKAEWFGNGTFFTERFTQPEWLEKGYHFLNTISPNGILFLLCTSVGLYVGLVYYEKKKRKKYRPKKYPKTSTLQTGGVKKVPAPTKPSTSTTVSKQRLDEEWERLDEGEREIVRELVNNGGLMEPDVIALLQARGLLPYKGAYEPLAERVNFITCDYVGFHSIAPEYQALLKEKLEQESKDDSFRC
jgi:hypothetical protein